ncbi:L-proline trans-4-hydroxylase [Dyadobacter sp. CECT 9275]|uniref:L-proline trans-4-hydroxylase n=1 Tax=Dyadobacter helix TaxID=2822344 RepID=A0A916N4F2_9BACT|nr:phytanoyl-CoA dioxygenase family protein [Dyadobacter sp. CECT 9275]CAG5000212.1 L-proline trans-4-hydroxylase [Dyadobacter sp. CECT 9275]
MTKTSITTDQIEQYNRDGFLAIRGFFSPEEVSKLYRIAVEDNVASKNAINVNDSSGKRSRLSLWYKPGDDVYGLLARSETLVDAIDRLMYKDTGATDGQDVCHYHSKLMQKEPHVGGAWEWHQDYGYWYKNEFLFPDQMMSVMVGITDANKENGCLQVIRGSHRMGRVEHGFSGEQVGASQRFVDLALQTMELVYVTLTAGDILFFHSNILHRSEANLSVKPRWSLISCYSRTSNISHNPSTSTVLEPIVSVPDHALLEWNAEGLPDNGADFLSKEADVSLK